MTEDRKTDRPNAGPNGLTRRRFLLAGGLFTASIGAVGGLLSFQPTLTALLDTMIPEDEFGPSASQTGAVDVVTGHLSGNLGRQLRMRAFLAWLNLRSGGSFALSSEERRLKLLEKIASGPQSSRQRRYLMSLRSQTMRHYYGSAARATELGFVGAPQPVGYPEAHLPWTGEPS